MNKIVEYLLAIAVGAAGSAIMLPYTNPIFDWFERQGEAFSEQVPTRFNKDLRRRIEQERYNFKQRVGEEPRQGLLRYLREKYPGISREEAERLAGDIRGK